MDNIECLKNNHNSTMKMATLKAKAREEPSFGEFDLSNMITLKQEDMTFKLANDINYQQSLNEITQRINLPKLNLSTGS
jgi:hypothetical protein